MQRTHFSDYHREKVPNALQDRRWCRNHVEVAGIHHRMGAALRFLKGAAQCERDGKPYGVRLERESRNTHDPNAIKVIGYWTERGGFLGRERAIATHVGYVPANYAPSYAMRADSGETLAAQLKSCYFGDDGYLGVDVVIYSTTGAASG